MSSVIILLVKFTMLQVKLERSYRSAKGNTVFVYAVNAKQEELVAYKAASGDYYRETENGTPLWFTTRCIGQSGSLVITSKGKIVPDMSAFEQAASLAKQFGGDFGNELAKATVAQLLGNKPKNDDENTVA
jgi:hypothetical protein